jgi:hypothetical protein
MEEYKWNSLKSERLKRTRGVSFEEIISAKLIDIQDSHSRRGQKLLLYEYKNYIWLVPCVQNGDEVFLKTLYPSRKYTKIYRREKKYEKD